MDISAAASSNAAASSSQTAEAVSVAVLKKTLEIQKDNAMQMIQSLPQPQYNNPPNLGKGVDTFA